MTSDRGLIAVPGARQQYVSYLTTSELVRAIEAGEQKLLTARQQHNGEGAQLWRDILADLRAELGSRQLVIRAPEKGAEI